MLEEAGIHARIEAPDLDDGRLRRGRVTPQQWVMALAYFKARRVADRLRGLTQTFAVWWGDQARFGRPGVVIGADTVCVADDCILGQPRNDSQARDMLHRLRNTEHRTITGVCLYSLADGSGRLMVDQTIVRIGALSDHQIQDYIASGDWRGKAGAYNLSERIAGGWSIDVEGDPTTVMGLPMRRLTQMLRR